MSAGAASRRSAFDFAPRIRAVLFDAGNTLMWLDHARMAKVVSGALGRDVTTPQMRAAEMRARPRLDPFLRGAVQHEGAEVVRRFADLVLAGLGCDPASSAATAAASALLGEWR